MIGIPGKDTGSAISSHAEAVSALLRLDCTERSQSLPHPPGSMSIDAQWTSILMVVRNASACSTCTFPVEERLRKRQFQLLLNIDRLDQVFDDMKVASQKIILLIVMVCACVDPAASRRPSARTRPEDRCPERIAGVKEAPPEVLQAICAHESEPGMPRCEQYQAFAVHDGMMRFECGYAGPWWINGYFNVSDRTVILKPISPPRPSRRFWYARDFSEGMASVSPDFGDNWGDQWGFIDTSGSFVIPPSFDQALSFSEGLAPVASGRRPIAKPCFHPVGTTNPQYIGSKWGFIMNNGKWAIRPSFDQAESFSEGLAAVRVGATWRPHPESGCFFLFGGKWGFINKAGALVIRPGFDEVRSFSEGLAAVRIGVKWTPDRVGNNVDGLPGGKWGFIDRKGTFLIQPQFSYAKSFKSGKAYVEIREKAFLLLRDGSLEETEKQLPIQ